MQQTQERSRRAQDTDSEERERRIRELQQQQEERVQEIQNLQQGIEAAKNQLQAKDQQFQQLYQRHASIVEEHQQLQNRTQMVVEELALKNEENGKQLRELNQQLETYKQLTAEFQQNLLQRDKVVRDLQESLTVKDRRIQQLEQQEASGRVASGANIKLPDKEDGGRGSEGDKPDGGVRNIHLRWRKSGRAPEKMRRGAAVVDGRVVYFKSGGSSVVHAYDSPTQQWSTLPKCPQVDFSLAVVSGLLTAIGGMLSGEATNTLLSLTGEDRGRKWSKEFPPMPTKRWLTAAVCSANCLIVAGGTTGEGLLKDNLPTVEVMDTETCQWLTARSLPHPFGCASATICGDRLYLLGGCDTNDMTKSLLTCSVPDLLHPNQPPSVPSLGERLKRALLLADQWQVWQKVADVPVYRSTCTTINGQLLAVGGWDSNCSATGAVYRYNPTSNSWEVISHMPTARDQCLVAVLPSSELMVVGGCPSTISKTDTVEIASVLWSPQQ